MYIEIIPTDEAHVPHYETEYSAGCDLKARLGEPTVIREGQRMLVPTGIRLGIPRGYEGQVRPRSGLALKHGITVLNAPGTIDADYRGEVGVVLINLSDADYTIQPGERIAQLVIAKCEQVDWDIVGTLSETERGDGGFGHTGK